MTSNKKKLKLIVITGPTATGKTSLATQLAYDIDSEIISADSRQVYKGMDIGTGKDLNEYVINNKSINYHLIDILDPMKDYSVYDFQKDFYEAYNDIQSKNKIPILCGGTGLYVESTLLKYDLSSKPPPNKELRIKLDKLDKKELLNQINLITTPKDRQNLLLETRKQIIRNIEVIKSEAHDSGFKLQPMNDSALVFGVQVETEQLRKKIKQRLIERIDEGMIDEVEELVDNGLPLQRLDYFGLEYKFIGKFLRSELTKDEFISGLTTSIRKFAKRQRTWFRRMEKRGVKINWIEPNNYAKLKNIVAEYIDES
jgi:tRNA dimethylallyltransferase